MKAILENKYKLTSENINTPFIVNGTPVGIVIEVTDTTFTILIWDRYIHAEKHSELCLDGKVKPTTTEAIHLGTVYEPQPFDIN